MGAKNSHERHGLSLFGLVVTLGIVYGDIGTSPLYVMKAILGANSHFDSDYIIGAISCIIWTLTIQTTLKYVVFTLRADNKGEGGILALYALLRKNKNKSIYLLAIAGAATLIADGIITPAITVLSAVEGLKEVNPSTPVICITLVIIAVLFLVQQFGTKVIGRSFGPLMVLWFSMLGVLGVISVFDYFPVLKAFNPYYAIHLLINYPNWFLIMGAVFLCTTGAEALYSDLGHCGIKNIRISWVFVKLTLILNYLGQGAWILSHQQQVGVTTNPFYAMMPSWFLLFGVMMATIAAVIASQALISGSFTIFSEAMSLNFWPRQKIKYPTSIKGQLYIPFVNMSLFVLCCVMVLLFRSSSSMEAAYGLSITITMLMTSMLLSFYIRQQMPGKAYLQAFIVLFVVIEFFFLIANLFKFSHGGWVTLVLAGVIATVMYVWYNARKIKNRQMKFLKIEEYYDLLRELKNDLSVPKYSTNLIYLSKANYRTDIESKIIYSIISKQPKRADHYWILHLDYVDEPTTLEYKYDVLIPDTLFRVDLRIGFQIKTSINEYYRQIVTDLSGSGDFDILSNYPSLRKHNIAGDFRFIIIHRIYSHIHSLKLIEKTIMNLYVIIKRIQIDESKAYGLDTSNVMIEDVPMLVNTDTNVEICRTY